MECNCCNGRGLNMEEKVVGYEQVLTEGQVREGYSLTYQVE
ncbi:putative methyltransferase [Oikeobacillus pervagus]|uniref:Methyltransferase n=1 Tax=Oikeobacillus pervagus TaxID=1325931 RepID=A0AAJ1T1I0_9BACI|nr:putative methyltransferase [Oikeobacillus pervagus]